MVYCNELKIGVYMDRNRWLIFGFITIAAVSWLAFASNRSSTNVNDVNAFSIQKDGVAADHVYGNAQAKVVLYEYGDFQCPGCASAHPIVKQVKEKYKDQIAFVFRNYPLTSIHPNALAAATVAEAAAAQGKFWEMHDLLYENQTNWQNLSAETRTQAFEGYASQINLDVNKFRSDLSNPALAEKISSDRAIGRKLKIESTPTFYINEQVLSVEDWNQPGALEAKIVAALKQAGVTTQNP